MLHTSQSGTAWRPVVAGSSLALLALLGGCVSQPVRTVSVYTPPASLPQSYIYPAQDRAPTSSIGIATSATYPRCSKRVLTRVGRGAPTNRRWWRRRRGQAQQPVPSGVPFWPRCLRALEAPVWAFCWAVPRAQS